MTPFVQNVTNLLSLGAIVLQIFMVLIIMQPVITKWTARHALWLGFWVSVVAVLSSLFYSQIAGFPPCEFCWWQRIFIYPQTVIFAVALYYQKTDKFSAKLALTSNFILSTIGAAIGLYQYYAQMFNPGLLSACAATGPSCAQLFFVSFGYITIPFMSLLTFVFIIVVIIARKKIANSSNA